MIQLRTLRRIGLGCVLGCFAGAAWAEEPYSPPRPTYNLFGITGLVDTPTADMQPDGQIALTSSYFGGFLRNTLAVQLFPGVEGTFRYSVLEDALGTRTNPRTLFDRSFDIKLKLVNESDKWPAVAIGLQDFLGTGVYTSEYIVSTKGFDAGDFGHFRVSAGLGWGRFADRSNIPNPLRGLSNTFGRRVGETGLASTGVPTFGQYFRGRNIGYFGGVEWITPIEGLTAKVEYSPDQYVRETRNGRRGDFVAEVPVNVGIEYRPNESLEIGAYYVYGSEFGVRLSLSGNVNEPLTDLDFEDPPKTVLPRQPLPNGARIASLGDVQSVIDDRAPTARFKDPRLSGIVLHTRLGNVRWVEASLTKAAGPECPDDLARAIDAEYGVIDVVTFTASNGNVICTVALRPAGQHAVRLTSRANAGYSTDWYQDEETRKKIVEDLAESMGGDNIGLLGIEIAPTRVQIYIENRRYYSMARAIGRSVRSLTRILPASVEVFEVTPVEGSLPISTVILQRSQIEDQVERPDAAERAWATAQVKDAEPVNLATVLADPDEFPRYSWSIVPGTPANLFDPDQPVRLDLQLSARGSIEFYPGLSASAVVSKRVIGQLDDITRTSDSLVENRVRSELAQYLREGDPALLRLSLDYVTKLTDSTYGRISAGYLERMFAGVSTEVLWKPVNQSWGLGLEVNYAAQRDFDSRFALQDYRVWTGHGSFYWDTDFQGIAMQIDVGRYLAGDWGGTFTLKRRFANGWELGGFFTLTTIPFDEFGEGSFDKGIFLTIPFNWITPFDTRSGYPIVLRPLTRDGGQRLEVAGRLYGAVDGADRGSLRNGWEGFWE